MPSKNLFTPQQTLGSNKWSILDPRSTESYFSAALKFDFFPSFIKEWFCQIFSKTKGSLKKHKVLWLLVT